MLRALCSFPMQVLCVGNKNRKYKGTSKSSWKNRINDKLILMPLHGFFHNRQFS